MITATDLEVRAGARTLLLAEGPALRIQPGGDHAFQGFAERLPALLQFAGLDPRLWQAFDLSTLTDRNENP